MLCLKSLAWPSATPAPVRLLGQSGEKGQLRDFMELKTKTSESPHPVITMAN